MDAAALAVAILSVSLFSKQRVNEWSEHGYSMMHMIQLVVIHGDILSNRYTVQNLIGSSFITWDQPPSPASIVQRPINH